MKLSILLSAILVLSSCGQIQRIMDGTEKLPSQIQETNNGMRNTNDAIRKQKIAEALKMLKEEGNRSNLIPIPFDMMSASKTLAEALTADETVLFFKNYIIKLNKQVSADVVPPISEEVFQHNRVADYYMLMLIAGFLPDQTVKQMIETESNQGAYQNIMFNILKLRVDFNSDMMLLMAMLGLNPQEKQDGKFVVVDDKIKLDTLGKIEKAIEYNQKVEDVCNLEFADKIEIKVEGFELPPLDKSKAKENWQIILERAQSDYKATSFSADPAKNEAQVKEYTQKFNLLIEKINQKINSK